MIIERIENFDKKRRKIYTDESCMFVLYAGEVRKLGIVEGQPVDCLLLEEIEEILKKRAFLRCLHLLEKRDYTERQIREKLRKGLYQENIISSAIEKCFSYGYINDESYARRYLECYINRKSLVCIRRDLIKKGLETKVLDRVMEEAKVDGILQDSSSMIRELLRKRHYYDKTADEKEKAKQYRYLLSKGFSSSEISKEL